MVSRRTPLGFVFDDNTPRLNGTVTNFTNTSATRVAFRAELLRLRGRANRFCLLLQLLVIPRRDLFGNEGLLHRRFAGRGVAVLHVRRADISSVRVALAFLVRGLHLDTTNFVPRVGR